MSLKRLNNKQVEILTDKYDIYIEKSKHGYSLDYFKSSVANANKAHEASEGHEEIETLEKQLKRLGVDDQDLSDLKKMWNLN